MPSEPSEPSELIDVFRAPVAPLPPPPDTFAAVRRRAAARRRRRALGVAAAVAGVLAGTTAVLAVTLPADGDRSVVPLASDGPAPTRDGGGEPTAEPAPGTGTVPATPGDPSPGALPSEESPSAASPSDEVSAGAPPRCATGDLALALHPDGAGAGSRFFTLAFTNTGEQVCTVTGYPGVSLVGGEDGTQVGAPARRGAERGTGTPVPLAPRGVAHADLRVTTAANYPTQDCRPTETRGLRVYPPDERDALFVTAGGLTGCADDAVELLSVTVVYEAPPAD